LELIGKESVRTLQRAMHGILSGKNRASHNDILKKLLRKILKFHCFLLIFMTIRIFSMMEDLQHDTIGKRKI